MVLSPHKGAGCQGLGSGRSAQGLPDSFSAHQSSSAPGVIISVGQFHAISDQYFSQSLLARRTLSCSIYFAVLVCIFVANFVEGSLPPPA